MIDEVDPARVVEGSSVALELVGEPAIERRRGGGGTRARTAVFGHEVVSAFALGDVVAGGRCALDTLAKDAGHEQREIADVPAHRDFVFRLEVRRIFPDRLPLEEQIDDGLEPWHHEAAGIEVLGAREASQQVGEVRRGRIVAERQVVEARPERPIEEAAQLHTWNDSKFSNLLESEPVADRPGTQIPWFLVAASIVLVLVVLYVLFIGYLPAKQRLASLEAELKDLYKRESELQTKIAQQDQRHALRERQISALTSERDTLIRRLEELERLLGTGRSPRR